MNQPSGTSACPQSRFYCENQRHIPAYILTSAVGDNICEVCCCQRTQLIEPQAHLPRYDPRGRREAGRIWRQDRDLPPEDQSFMEEKYGIDAETPTSKTAFKRALEKGVESGELILPNGISGKIKMASKAASKKVSPPILSIVNFPLLPALLL